MRCGNCNNELANTAKFCPDCGASVQSQAAGINTGGGAYIAGSATAGGDIIGRDQEIHGDYKRTTQSGLQGQDLARFTELFSDVYKQVDMRAAEDPDVDPDLLKSTARQVEQEAAKGENADPSKVKRALTALAKLAPDVLEVAVNAITNPGAAVASAVRIVAEQVRALTS
jgi:zinc-ribbon domain